MKKFASAMLMPLTLLAASASAEDNKLSIEAAFSYAPVPGVPAAGYVTLTAENYDDRLIGASSPVAEMVQIHRTEVDADGIAMMRKVNDLALPADQSIALAPGGLHLMVMGLSESYAPGDTIPVTLTFEVAGEADVEFKVFQRGAQITSAVALSEAEITAAGAEPEAGAPADRVIGKMQSLLGDARQRSAETLSGVRQNAGELVDSAGDRLNEAKATAGNLVGGAQERLAEATDRTGAMIDTVTENTGEVVEGAKELVRSATETAAGTATDTTPETTTENTAEPAAETGTETAEGAADTNVDETQEVVEKSKGIWGRMKTAITGKQ